MLDDPASLATFAFAMRVGERLLISLLVVLIALTCAVGFWRSLQKVDFQFGHDELSGGAKIVLATPVFALLALIGFAWISFSNPFTVAAGDFEFVGATPTVTAAAPAAAPSAFAATWADARELLRSLNCLAEGAEAEGLEIPRREHATLATLKLGLMMPHWQAAWGDREAFRDWALGGSGQSPNAIAAAAYSESHSVC